MSTTSVRVITIDGPSSSGKGTIARLLAMKLGWNFLDSGALYRAVGLVAIQQNLEPTDPKLSTIAQTIDVTFVGEQVFFKGIDVTEDIRAETTGEMASKVAIVPSIRVALLTRQRSYARQPGLVADGRDMGTLVFPAAQVKIFLTANADERVHRRYKQLKEKGLNVNLTELTATMHTRDERDRTRSMAP
ncbi:cytidylate kinase, partial [Achromatium sp. WMS1]